MNRGKNRHINAFFFSFAFFSFFPYSFQTAPLSTKVLRAKEGMSITFGYPTQSANRAYFGDHLTQPTTGSEDSDVDPEDVVVNSQQRREVLGLQAVVKSRIEPGVKSCLTSPNEQSELAIGNQSVTEMDLAAYSKTELETSLRKHIMKRMFYAFDSLMKGYLDMKQIQELCVYLGRNLTEEQSISMAEELALEASQCGGHSEMDRDLSSVKVTFELFWKWWESKSEGAFGDAAFSLIQGHFAEAYHQQQMELEEEGEIFTPSYRVKFFFRDLENGYRRQVSPWHDIPFAVRDPVRTKPSYIAPNRFNFICEVPKWTRAKFEVATGEPYNPIKQDMKNGIPRFYKHGDMMWNYGAFPQTWESTEIKVEGYIGDNDPLDGVEIGMRQMRVGAVTAVKVLGILGMIDDNQMDWKVIIIAVDDPVARFIRDIEDVPKFLPGCLDAIREFFRVYKICQGGVENKFAFNGEFKDKEYALRVMNESHHMWNNLRKIHGKEKV